MMKRFLGLTFLLVFFFMSGFILLDAQSASAALKLKLESSGGTTVTIEDNGPGDTDATVGLIVFKGPIGTFDVLSATGLSKPVVGDASVARLNLTAVTINSVVGSTLTISLTDTDFGAGSGNTTLTSEIGGTNSNGTTSFQGYLDPANVEFGTSCTSGSQGPLGGAFDDTATGPCTLSGPFSLTAMATVTGTGIQSFGSSTSAPFPPPECSIGDYVWEDADRDGCQGADEGIEGVVVKLFDGCFGNEIATTTTDANGFYKFDGLECEKDYGIQFVDDPTDIYEQTTANQMCVPGDPDASDKEDSDCGDEGKVCVPASTLPPGTFNDTIDCGYVCEGEIGDFVWLDFNGAPGCQDSNEPGIMDVIVNLFEVDGCPDVQGLTPFMTTTTDDQGKYLFAGLCPGDYRVTFDDPEGRDNTIVDQDCEALGLPDSNTKDSDCGGDDECVTLTVGNPVDETIDCGKVPPCELAVEKFCSLVPKPFVCSDAKPIDSLTMVWGGAETINAIEVYRDKFDPSDPSKNLMYTIFGPIAPGDEVTADGYVAANAKNDVDWHIFFDGGSDGISRFHRSCSDDDMNGPEDCGKNEGNAKSTDPAFVNDWLFAGMAGNGLTLDCTPDLPALQDECEVFAVKPGSCDDGKPTALVFKYTGEGCVDGNDQASDKWSCSGDPGFAEPVQVVMTKDASKFTVTPSNQTIGVGTTFEIRKIDGGDFPSEIKFDIRQDGQKLQSLKIHTSCSQHLNVGDQFGSVILEQFFPKGSTASSENVIYTYKVTNSGPADATVDVVDDKLGQIADDLLVPAGETVELTQGALLADPGTVTNVVTVTDIDDPDCSATDQVTVNVVEPPASCEDGKPTALVFEYTGDDCNATTNLQNDKFSCSETGALGGLVDVVMTKDADKISVEVTGNTVKVYRSDTLGKEFPSEIKYKVIGDSGTQSQTLHTSCSQPLNVGNQFGALTLKTFIPKQ